MNSKRLFLTISMMALVALAVPAASNAQELNSQSKPHVQYKLFDLGTLGGSNSGPALPVFGGDPSQSLSRGGVFAGQAETSIPDPFAPNCWNSDCLASHAIRWEDGRLTDLGALPGPAGLTSVATWVSDNGSIVGISLIGVIDPFTGSSASRGVVWKQNQIIDLGVLKGGYESVANAVNSYGEVVGFANNGVPDANSLNNWGTQTRAVVWRNGMIHDLDTLGGTDAVALFVSEYGQIVGESYTASSIPNPSPSCGDSPLTLHAFFWENGKMVDLNTLGGNCTFAYALNNRAQVIGQSTLAGDQTSHPFLWEKGTMKDLGALGGDYGYAIWLNDAGEVVGNATNEGEQALLAFQWKGGVMTNLGTLPGNACSVSDDINSTGQVVGGSGFSASQFFPACTDLVEHAVLWENGRMTDLNSYVPASSSLTLNEAVFINDSGEISGVGSLPNGDQHAFLLVPCREGEDGCEEATENPNLRQNMPVANRSSSEGRTVRLRPFACTRSCGVVRTLYVDIAGDGSGTVTSSPPGISCSTSCSANFQTPTGVTLTATPLNGSTFTGWGCIPFIGRCHEPCSGTGRGCHVFMINNTTVTATFRKALSASFSLTPAKSSLTLQPGGQMTDVITVAPQNGAFASAIQLTCVLSGPAPVPACAFSSPSVTPGANSVSSTLTIRAAGTSGMTGPSAKPAGLLSVASVLITMLGIVSIAALRKGSRAQTVLFGFLLLILLQSACGGGGGKPKPPQEMNYIGTVNGDSGSIHETAPISVTVQ